MISNWMKTHQNVENKDMNELFSETIGGEKRWGMLYPDWTQAPSMSYQYQGKGAQDAQQAIQSRNHEVRVAARLPRVLRSEARSKQFLAYSAFLTVALRIFATHFAIFYTCNSSSKCSSSKPSPNLRLGEFPVKMPVAARHRPSSPCATITFRSFSLTAASRL